jgi:hypothetical protein
MAARPLTSPRRAVSCAGANNLLENDERRGKTALDFFGKKRPHISRITPIERGKGSV